MLLRRHIGTPTLVLLSAGLGTPFGNLTGGVGLSGVFAGSGLAWTSGFVGMGRIGKIWPAPLTIHRLRAISGGIHWDEAAQDADITLRLTGSNDTTDGVNGTWAQLYTTTFADPPYDAGATQDTKDITTGINVATAYKAHAFEITGTYPAGGQDFGLSLLEYYTYQFI